jgi:hypothetical protein
MAQKKVVIYESVRHSLLIEADNDADALEKAYELVGDHTEGYLIQHYEYDKEEEYTGYYEISEESNERV